MDSFETIRHSAVALHSKLVSAGVDPDRPMDLVEAAIADFDLVLAWLPVGDPTLKGARALFDEQAGIICCEDKGMPGERACLVAHEIGHVCIHAGSSLCVTEDVDPSRSMEAAPVGLQRVEDYGARERRELQANVFAREFLLPRSVARAKHLAGEIASAIAGQLGLPKDLVRQQLLDALLLPPLPPSAEEKKSDLPVTIRPKIAPPGVAAARFNSKPGRAPAKPALWSNGSCLCYAMAPIRRAFLFLPFRTARPGNCLTA